MNGSNALEKFQAERSLSYIIENDQDYGSKLSKLLAHNSSGVPMLGINSIRFHEKMGDNVAEMDFLIEELISKSKILDGSEMQFYACSSVESLLEFEEPRSHVHAHQNEHPLEPSEGQDATPEADELEPDKSDCIYNIDKCSVSDEEFSESELAVEEKDKELEECLQIVDGEEQNAHVNPNSDSNPLNIYFDNIYEKSFECLSKTLDFECEDKILGAEDHQLSHVPDNSDETSLKSEDSGKKALLSESKSKPKFELESESKSGPKFELEIESKPEPKLELELELELESIKQEKPTKANTYLYIPENTETLRLATEDEQANSKEVYNKDQVESGALVNNEKNEWRMKIENMMRSHEKNSLAANHYVTNMDRNISSSYSEGGENFGYNSNIHLRDNIQGIGACAGAASNASTITTGLPSTAKQPSLLGTKDLKTGVIREIEHELKGCRFSLNAGREGQSWTKSTGDKGLEGGKLPSSCLNRARELNLELDLSFAVEQDQEFSTDSEYDTQLDPNNAPIHKGNDALAHQIAAARPPPQYSPIDLKHQPDTFLLEDNNPKLEMPSLRKAAHSLANNKTHMSHREIKLFDLNMQSSIEAPNKEMSLIDLGGNKNTELKKSQLGDTVGLEQTLNLSSGTGGATGQPAVTKTPESVITAIKLLGVVRDIKRQIKLIKRDQHNN